MTREEKIICKEFLDDADKTHSCNEYKLLMALLEQEPTTKNDLAVDCRSLKDIKKLVERKADDLDGVMLDAGGVIIGLYFAIANDLPSVTPQDIDYKAQYERLSQKAEIVISQLRADRDRLMSLISVTPQETRWIPVSERLPTKEEYIANNGLFIVSDGNRTYAEYFDVYSSMKYFGEPAMNGFRVDRCVTAWMPVPEPYKAESEDNK